jgi:hypothetical protein
MVLKSIPFFGEYRLRYDWEAYERMTEELGVSAFSEFSEVMKKLGPKTLRIMLWAGLLHSNPTLKPADVFPILNEYVDQFGMDALAEVIVNALTEASILGNGRNDPGEVKPPKGAKR